jgi:outer membrane protein TolC
VEGALVAYRTDRAARDKAGEAVQAGETTLYLARNSYTHGLTDFIQALDAERTVVGSRQQLVQANVALTNDVVALYTALGGGWQEHETETTASVTTIPPPMPAAVDTLAAVPPR